MQTKTLVLAFSASLACMAGSCDKNGQYVEEVIPEPVAVERLRAIAVTRKNQEYFDDNKTTVYTQLHEIRIEKLGDDGSWRTITRCKADGLEPVSPGAVDRMWLSNPAEFDAETGQVALVVAELFPFDPGVRGVVRRWSWWDIKSNTEVAVVGPCFDAFQTLEEVRAINIEHGLTDEDFTEIGDPNRPGRD